MCSSDLVRFGHREREHDGRTRRERRTMDTARRGMEIGVHDGKWVQRHGVIYDGSFHDTEGSTEPLGTKHDGGMTGAVGSASRHDHPLTDELVYIEALTRDSGLFTYHTCINNSD